MNKTFSATLPLTFLALILFVTNLSLAITNRAAQRELVSHQEAVAQGQAVLQIDQAVVRIIAEAAVKHKDTQLRSLLAAEGITLQEQPAKK
ncbi:MAG: hypothetical protein PHE27_09220 [Alphaproteobacteria bacterium]|nr:hypothetical protein [Alphaproteobacteria bacterium]